MNAASHHSTSTLDSTPTQDYEVAARIQQSPVFRDYQDAFETATGLPLVFRHLGSFEAPMAGSRRISSFCALLAGKNKACSACLELQVRLEAEPLEDTRTVCCFAGLSESAIPVKAGGRVIGYLQTGQILLSPPTEADFKAIVAALEKWKTSPDHGLLRHAFFETRVLTQPRYHAVLRLLESFASHLSTLSNELMIAQNQAEPRAITKSREYISGHLNDELSLQQVAQVAGISSFYFCKVFRAATGLTFTDYVARARVEAVKEALLNPQTRISEAAFACGFQSLSQFNRVFRRVTGEAPTRFRTRTHRPSSSLFAAA